MRFAGWRRDGSFLASSGDGPSPVDRCLRRIFPGLALALRQMAPGEQRRVWVPARLTFDPDDRESPPGVDATFDLELVEIVRAPPAPQDLKRPPPSALRQPGGLRLRFLQRGSGREHPTERARVKLNFTGWTAAGRLIESSLMAGQPALFELSGVMVGWRQALVQMVPGDKVRLWIPPALAFGDQPRRGQPRGPLVYDLELLAIE